jgi:hypothetical protein
MDYGLQATTSVVARATYMYKLLSLHRSRRFNMNGGSRRDSQWARQKQKIWRRSTERVVAGRGNRPGLAGPYLRCVWSAFGQRKQNPNGMTKSRRTMRTPVRACHCHRDLDRAVFLWVASMVVATRLISGGRRRTSTAACGPALPAPSMHAESVDSSRAKLCRSQCKKYGDAKRTLVF